MERFLIRNTSFPARQHEEEDISRIVQEENPCETVELPEFLNVNVLETRGDHKSRQLSAALSRTQIPPAHITFSLENVKTEPMQQLHSGDVQVRLVIFYKYVRSWLILKG